MPKPPHRPIPPTYAVDVVVTNETKRLPLELGAPARLDLPRPTVTTTFKYNGAPVAEFVGQTFTVYAPGLAVVDEMVRRANAHDGLVRALTSLDAWIGSLMADPVHPDQEAYGFDIMRARIAAALDVELPAVSGCTES